MTSAWTNLSCAIMHSDIEREWENQGGVDLWVLYFITGDCFSPSEELYIYKKIVEWWGDQIYISNFVIALEHLGANEQWSLWSTAHIEYCSLGLLHSFWFWHTFVIVRVHADDKWNISTWSLFVSENVSLFMQFICIVQWKLCCTLLVQKMSGRFSRTIYVGNLPADIRESEIEDLFYKVCFKCFHVTLILVCRIMRFVHFQWVVYSTLSLLLTSEIMAAFMYY